jgi:hypothetical protein
MRSRSTLALLAGALMLTITTAPSAQTGSGSVLVRVNVVRSCSLKTTSDIPSGAVSVTCSRGTAAVLAASSASPATRVVPLPARQTTVIAARPPQPSSLPASTYAAAAPTSKPAAPALQVITLNF